MTTTAPNVMPTRWIDDAIAHDDEHFRLLAVEGTYDPHTTRLLRDEIGVEAGWRCLDVGAGAASITRWLASHVGPAGEVVALDMNCRFLTDLPANVQVVEHTLGEPLPDVGTFDLIHHRAVLSYVPERLEVLPTLAELLRPGGWLLSEEPVFATSGDDGVSAGGDLLAAARRAYQGALDLLRLAGTDLDFGLELPRLLLAAGLLDVLHDGVALVTPGSDGPRSDVVWPVIKALAAQLEQACGMTPEDIDAGITGLRDPATWHQLPVMVSAWGRRPAARSTAQPGR